MKKINKIGLILLSAIALSSCVKQNNYPLGPVITFKEFVVNPNGSATVQITFTDGYGTIGSKNPENKSPNFFIEVLSKDTLTGQFVPIGGFDTLPYIISYITQSGLTSGLSGQIQIALPSTPYIWWIKQGATYEYRMWLIDAGGYISNRVTSYPVKAP